jgi:exopolysaccharide biosynthesis polyprenyl glycosylphosphotransferase
VSIVTDPSATFAADAQNWPQESHAALAWRARDPLRRRMLAAGDAATVGAIGLALAATAGEAATWSLLFAPVWLVLAKLHGLYDRDHRALRHLTVDELSSIFVWATTGTMLLALFLRAATGSEVSIWSAATVWLVAVVAAAAFRSLARYAWRRFTPPERVMIVGSGPIADATRRKLELFPDVHCELVEERSSLQPFDLGEHGHAVSSIDRVIVASNSVNEELLARLVGHCRRRGIKLSVVPPARGIFATAAQLTFVADLPVVEYNTWDVSRSTLVLKRALDLALASIALLLLAPVLAVIGALLFLAHGRPILFSQTRIGANENPFRMFKFRTMIREAETLRNSIVPLSDLPEPVYKLPRDPRVTPFGRFLRKTSLDELPQLVNVLKGDMSLVGPRPEEANVVELYEDAHRFRLAVKPGLTGPMQVYGRGELTFQERLAVEREYIENLSLGRDLRILAMTVIPVLSGRGAY